MKTSKKYKGGSRQLGLEKKLALYGLAGSALLALPAAAKADIIYNTADTTISWDLNTKEWTTVGSSEFGLSGATFLMGSSINYSAGSITSYAASLFSSSSSMVAGEDDYATAFNAGDAIGESTSWLTAGSKAYLVDYTINEDLVTNSGNWLVNGTPAYAGLVFNVGDDTYYGWARVAATFDAITPSFTLYDWAYENEAGESILAGDTGTPSTVPEPTTLSLFALGAVGLGMLRRGRKQDSAEA